MKVQVKWWVWPALIIFFGYLEYLWITRGVKIALTDLAVSVILAVTSLVLKVLYGGRG